MWLKVKTKQRHLVYDIVALLTKISFLVSLIYQNIMLRNFRL